MIVLTCILILFILYAILILFYWSSWKNIPVFEGPQSPPTTKLSIIIPARNEEENIGALLQSIRKQDYPEHLMEVIVINDNSTDNTAGIVAGFAGVKLIHLMQDETNSYKKKAVETGIQAAKGDLIITTDADCYAGPRWLSHIAGMYEQKQAAFIAAPVVINCGPSLVEIFQAYDFAVLQGITGASVYRQVHSMSNGANQAYTRAAFLEVGGFEGIDHIASGDDMLLMHKIGTRYPGRTFYLKSPAAIVATAPVKTWKAFFQQRIRWASKATHYTDKRITVVLALVYLFNCSFLFLLIAGAWDHAYWWYAGGLWIAKTVVEFPFVLSVSRFFEKQWLMKYFFFLQPLHIFYTIVSGLFGQFGKYQWKGRQVR